MMKNVFLSLISITKGLHRDNRNESEFKHLTLINDNQCKAEPKYEIEFPERPIGNKRKYFKSLIDTQAIDKFNNLISEFPDNAIIQENQFTYTKLYNEYKQNLISVNNYIKNHSYNRANLKKENTYIIQYLKVNMIWLFLELQERYSEFGNEDIFSIEEIYNYYFNENLDSYDIKPILISFEKSKSSKEKIPAKKISFGYKYKDVDKLFNALKLLQLKIDLLDESRTSIKDFADLLTAKDYTRTTCKIYLFCETTQFRYIIDCFKPHFTNFTPTSIEVTSLFFTKNNIALKKSNLYKNKVYEPKAKTEIDNIINQLQ